MQPFMEELDEDGIAFAVPDLWKPSSFTYSYMGGGSLGIDRRNTSNSSKILSHLLQSGTSNSLKKVECPKLHLPDISSFEYGPLETIGTVESSVVESTNDSVEDWESVEYDPWSDLHMLGYKEIPLKLMNWELFHDKSSWEPRTTYMSEGGPVALDAALRLNSQDSGLLKSYERQIVRSDQMLTGLALLGLGRESLLFQYVESEQSFRPSIKRGRMSGYTPESFESLVAVFVGYGNTMRNAHRFISKLYSSKKSCPTFIALANTLSTVLTIIDSQFGDLSILKNGVLQLQSIFYRPGLILKCLSEIIAKVHGSQCDEELLSKLYSYIEEFEHTDAWLRPILFEILARASRPWLESVQSWIGLNESLDFNSHTQNIKFVDTQKEWQKDEEGKAIREVEYKFIPSIMPCFITEDDAQFIFETGRGLRLLRAHEPNHPLTTLHLDTSQRSFSLEWRFSWQDVERIERQAQQYKSGLLDAIKSFHTGGLSQLPSVFDTPFSKRMTGRISTVSEEMVHLQITESITKIEAPILNVMFGAKDNLSLRVLNCSSASYGKTDIESESFSPPLSVLPLLSFSPLLAAQAALVNQACLGLLFKKHNLQMHLTLHHRFSLFGDGVFATRLSHALFDPDLGSAERCKGHSRSGISGLRLGYRDSWPPASSELRLVLMGILNESFHQGEHTRVAASFRTELPGGLSFAIRDMAEGELERCMDPDSIEALDFLRLQYRPPSPLDAVITPSCLAKYDILFRTLLRGTRMLFVVNHLLWGSAYRKADRSSTIVILRRFPIEANHFVSTICSYFFDGVRSNWLVFSQKLNAIERRLDNYDAAETNGLHHLQGFHEQVLDRMMFALLLRQRQAQMMTLLEEIFSSILVFARYLRAGNAARTSEVDAKIEDVYMMFRKKVRVFVSVCRGLSERRGPGGLNRSDNDLGTGGFMKEDWGEDRGNTIGQLLLKLEMSGYYARDR